MKPRKTTATILSLILISTVVASSVGYVVAASSSSEKYHGTFTLTALGTAYNTLTGDPVPVSLSVTGSADGGPETVLILRVEGGDVHVGTYDTLTPSGGVGVLLLKIENVHLTIMMTSAYYGGTHTVWVLEGKKGWISGGGSTMGVALHSDRVLLPLDDYPRLNKLSLTGTLTLNPAIS